MHRVPVISKALVSVGYDSHTQQLEIEFRGGRVYRYNGVSGGAFQFLMRAQSKGGYVNRMIEGRYAYQDVTPGRQAELEQDVMQALEASLRERLDPGE
jgi:hypothetical protein